MSVKQLSVFVENKCGRASAIINLLSENNINISALCVAESSEYGIMRLIVDNSEKAEKIVSASGVMAKITNVLAIPMGNKPGDLAKLLNIFNEAKISVQYMYAFVGQNGNNAVLVIKTDNNTLATEILGQKGISLLCDEDIY